MPTRSGEKTCLQTARTNCEQNSAPRRTHTTNTHTQNTTHTTTPTLRTHHVRTPESPSSKHYSPYAHTGCIAKQANFSTNTNANTNMIVKDCKAIGLFEKKTSCLCGGHITGAPNASSNQGPNSPSLNHMSMASILIPPACNHSEKREILIVGRTTSFDKPNIGQKPSKPYSVFCPIQPHQCRGARHNRIAGIVHLRTPTTRKKSPSFTPDER